MALHVKVTFDTRELVRGLKRLETSLQRESANALNRVARRARGEFNRSALAEVNVPRKELKLAGATVELPAVRPSAHMVSTFGPNNVSVSMSKTRGSPKSPLRGNQKKLRPLSVKTHGTKVFSHGYVIQPKNHAGSLVYLDRKADKGRAQHPLLTTKFTTLLSQERSVQRKIWTRTVVSDLCEELPKAVESAIEKAFRT